MNTFNCSLILIDLNLTLEPCLQIATVQSCVKNINFIGLSDLRAFCPARPRSAYQPAYRRPLCTQPLAVYLLHLCEQLITTIKKPTSNSRNVSFY